MPIWRFSIQNKMVKWGKRERRRITHNGCNEPFKGHYWCPEIHWFRREACPFISRYECEIYKLMCGCL